MDTIKLLLAHADRRVTNQIEVAVLDVCYDQAVVRSTRTTRLDEFVRQGSIWDFDLVIVGAQNLYADRAQQSWATPEDVANGIRAIRSQSSVPIIALTTFAEAQALLQEAGAHCVLRFPFNPEQFKSEVRPLLDLNPLVKAEESDRCSTFGALFKGLQKAKAGN